MALLKLIRCKVAAEKRAAFCNSQQAWQPIADCKGFIAQLGGWEIPSNNQGLDDTHLSTADSDAIVLGMWRSEADLSQFMAFEHDKIFDINQQQTSYLSCKVSRFNEVSAIHQAEVNDKTSSPALLHIKQYNGVINIHIFRAILMAWLSVATQKQRKPICIHIWQHTEDTDCLLITSLWKNQQAYEQDRHSPHRITIQSRLNTQCHSTKDCLIKLESLWNIAPQEVNV
ncbi:DUF4937 domain-containing protein [Shewanella sp.]|uniref:DUF4937 domain-containing protein n=2 Tax=Shewanella sp. TaxID=50422 RepID=UPI0040544906